MLNTCGRGPGPPQVGPGPPRAIRTPADASGTSTCHPDSRRCVRDLHVPIRTPRELSAQLAAREGSGAATCHADAGTGASLLLEAPSPTRIKCEWLRRALLPLGRGSFCQSTLWIASYRGGSSVTKASIKDSTPRAWATSHDDQLLTGATVHAAIAD